MTNGLGETLDAYKIWKNSSKSEEPVWFLGNYRRPKDSFEVVRRNCQSGESQPG